ncbi:flavin reductase family protein [Kitasatospora sp. NPDC058190]|uniref:flavin reductase family protein n=1 Tax=Kitasatospora sp. NPDC058190 TaxID=3346371 RepID=UPI0036DB560B
MSREIPSQLWKSLTSTIGLVSVRNGDAVNVMSAEWSYFVNKEPLYVAVVLSPASGTRQLLATGNEFGLTLCSEEQAELADFAGSFSLTEIDKSSSELVRFGAPEATGTPWVEGGLLALECRLRNVVEFPVHHMYVGEVVAAHVPKTKRSPLVKHGPMHALGPQIRRTAVVAAAQFVAEDVLRVAATGPSADPDQWRITLLGQDGQEVDLGTHPAAEYGDLLVDLPLPASVPTSADARVRVERAGAKPGYARLAPRRTA